MTGELPMKCVLDGIELRTGKRRELIDVSDDIRRLVERSSIQEGFCILWVPHTTAAVTINENADPDVKTDIVGGLERLAPFAAGYLHGEGNSDAHILSSLFGPSLTLIVSSGAPLLGTWQGILFCEFDGPRSRRLHVRIVGN